MSRLCERVDDSVCERVCVGHMTKLKSEYRILS